jgi:hypothetical protein
MEKNLKQYFHNTVFFEFSIKKSQKKIINTQRNTKKIKKNFEKKLLFQKKDISLRPEIGYELRHIRD